MSTLTCPSVEKLVDYTASGVGAIAGPMLAPWIASQQAKAERIQAAADAHSLRLISKAQSDARQAMLDSANVIQSELQITRDQIAQRLEFQEIKRQQNITAAVAEAADELTDEEVEDHEPDHDSTAPILRVCSRRFVGGRSQDLGQNPCRATVILVKTALCESHK